ncbi:MAG TPA: VOC family protein [Acidimicrobiales bacterium]|nr:VOC family protein [Acidimicrobiales bacterium]
MPARTSYAEGTPNWVDLQTPDQDAAKAFYGELFGWQFDDQPMPEGPVYSMAVKGDGVVAAIAPQSPEMIAGGAPPMWNTYIAVDDVDAATERAQAAGGQVLMQPFDVMEAGRMSFVADPTGAAVGLWQAKGHIGATIVNEHGACIWNELLTDDGEAATAFYTAVVGLIPEPMDMAGDSYTVLKVGDRMVGGTMAPPMEGIPNHWHVYFAVDDIDEAVAKALELGASVLNGPFETPVGRMAALSDPQGAMFSLHQSSGEAE